MTSSHAHPQRRRTFAWLLAAAGVLLALSASATSQAALRPPGDAAADPALDPAGSSVTGSTSDPDDTLGRLDIARVAHRVSQLGRHRFMLDYRVGTFAAFGSPGLDVQHRNFVLELNRDTQPGSERNVRVSQRDGSLVAEVISNATREVIATVEVNRPNDQTIRISGPRRVLGARSYFWTSNFHAPRSSSCGEGDGFPIICQDTVPEHGWTRLDSPAWPNHP